MNEVLMIGLAAGCALDWRFRKIPNAFNLCLAVTGIFFQIFNAGIEGFQTGITGILVGIALLYFPFLLGGVGGGDVKLLGAIGAFVGPVAVIKVFLVGAVFGGLFTLLKLVKEKALISTWTQFKEKALFCFLTKRWTDGTILHFAPRPLAIPYAFALSCGYLWVSLFGGG